VRGAIDKLAAAELIFRRGDKANPRFTFKHALVQEGGPRELAAFPSGRPFMCASSKCSNPSAEVRRAKSSPITRSARSEPTRPLATGSRRANAALAKSAYAEGSGHFTVAIELVRNQTDGVDRRAQELELHLHLGQANIAFLGYGAEGTRTVFERCERLA